MTACTSSTNLVVPCGATIGATDRLRESVDASSMRKPPKGKSAHNLSGKRTVCDWHSGKSERPFRAEGVSAAVRVRESLRLLTQRGAVPLRCAGRATMSGDHVTTQTPSVSKLASTAYDAAVAGVFARSGFQPRVHSRNSPFDGDGPKAAFLINWCSAISAGSPAFRGRSPVVRSNCNNHFANGRKLSLHRAAHPPSLVSHQYH